MASLTRTFGIAATIAGVLLLLSLQEVLLGVFAFIVGLVVLGSTFMRSNDGMITQAKDKQTELLLVDDEVDLNSLDDEDLDKLAGQHIGGNRELSSRKLGDIGISDGGKGSHFSSDKNKDDMGKQWWLFNRNQQMQRQSQDMLRKQMDIARKQQEEWRRQQEMRRRRQ